MFGSCCGTLAGILVSIFLFFLCGACSCTALNGLIFLISQVKIAWSDTDNYKHTNFSSYLRFAIDAVHDALKQGKLQSQISEAEVSSGTAVAKVAYLGESVEGDVLRVKVWCPEGLERTVMCSMEKEGQVVNQVTLTFHSAERERAPLAL